MTQAQPLLSRKQKNNIALPGCLLFIFLFLNLGCDNQPTVVIYTALDRMFSEPILKEFEKKTGIRVLAKYDTESTKTIGLVGAIRSEKNRPRCDVFWNNEIINTIRLKKEGILEVYRSPKAEAFPGIFKDPDGTWTGFAARARVLLVNNHLVPQEKDPASIFDLTNPEWKGKIGIAKPLFGTTATHAACLFAFLGKEKASAFFDALKNNEVCIEAGNKSCAEKVSSGELAAGLTDTDDAIIEVNDKRPVRIVYLDIRDGQMGTLFIPNTVALIKGAPNPEGGKMLIDFLLSPEVEAWLADCPSAQIPLNPEVKISPKVKTPKETKSMEVNFSVAADMFESTADYIKKHFLTGN